MKKGTKEIATRIDLAVTKVLNQATEWLKLAKEKVVELDKKTLNKRYKQLESLSIENTKTNIVPTICEEYNLNSDFIIKILEI